MTDARMILLNPGPVTLTDRVRKAMSRADWCHREPEFAALSKDVNRRLANLYPGSRREFAAVSMTGSGTCAVEAMLSSLAPRDGVTMIVANGVYGERMAGMLDAQGKRSICVQSEWLEPMALAEVEKHLEEEPAIAAVAAVHHETTTGRLNDMNALGRLCKAHGCPLLLDAVSSFGAEEILFDEWNVQALAGTANKCLHGVPGICFVIVDREVLERSQSQANSVYLDVFRYFKTQDDDGYSPFTQAVQAAFALQEALIELEESGGWRERRSRYRSIAHSIQDTAASHRVDTLLAPQEYSSVLWSYVLPEGVAYPELHDSLKREGFVIYAGQGHLGSRIFRIAHMGDIRDSDVERFQAALTSFFG